MSETWVVTQFTVMPAIMIPTLQAAVRLAVWLNKDKDPTVLALSLDQTEGLAQQLPPAAKLARDDSLGIAGI